MPRPETNRDPAAIGLQALAWALGEPTRAERFLALTGITPDELRSRLTEPAMLAAALGFLENHEPDLIACAEALDLSPQALVRARMEMDI
ncbi:DUF3572 domain-containing protein [Sphingomonas sp. KC8]|uniref:DUF3572 domain-containing protein n=2 Tax=Sphingomonas sp. KC8 TaxID=1030157 RepID=UPI000A31D098|nr:DUF3572 domain-containing protein [Sphingomonas sp. KC8]ARS28645.1 hypothetical protein KC8_15295 [Sphingomonas sp. KC8]